LGGRHPADARRFDLQGIKTVQQLAHVSDMNLSGLGVGAMALREKAREFLSGNTTEVQLRQQLGDQSRADRKLTDIVNSLLEKQPNRPRHPRRKRSMAKSLKNIMGAGVAPLVAQMINGTCTDSLVATGRRRPRPCCCRAT
jgi:hypothetical protein